MEKVLEVKDLRVSFKTDNGNVQAVRGVSFDLHEGETLCIVGESGSGKSVTSKAIMGILAKNAIIEDGEIIYQGDNILNLPEEEFYKIRGHKVGMIFQDPLSSLNPIVKIGKQITEATLVNGNKLKQKFNDLIIVENTAYNNCISRYNAAVKSIAHDVKVEIEKRTVKSQELNDAEDNLVKIKNQITEALNANNEELAKTFVPTKENLQNLVNKLTKEREALIKTVSKEENDKVKELLKTTKTEHLVEKKELSTKLSNRKKEAKIEVKAYKHQVKHEYKTKLAVLKTRLSNATATETPAVKLEIQNEKDEFKNKLKVTRKVAKEQALQIMKDVGIPQPEKRFNQYPFEFSGGMRQRIVIAIALTAKPDILICDEPTTALDVTIQAQILDLINSLKKEKKLSCVFITHDLGVVANMADRVAVMYAGKIVEYGNVNEIFYEPKHPYTWALLSSVPDVDSAERLEAIPGTPPNMIYPPKGDAFALRSKYAMNIDFKEQPPFFKVSDTHYAATWLLHPDAPKVEMPKIVSTRIEQSLKGGQHEIKK